MVIYFFWPAAKDWMLESLDEVFQAPNPVKKSLDSKINHTVLEGLNIK